MKRRILIWALIFCLCACAAAETSAAPTAALLETIRKDNDWMQADGTLYHGARLHCSLHDGNLPDAQIFSTDDNYLETILTEEGEIVVVSTFATPHGVEAFMDDEFMPDSDIERPEDYAEIAGDSYNQYRFTTCFAETEFAVDAFSFSADETIFLFLAARPADADAGDYPARLDDWMQTMRILPAES